MMHRVGVKRSSSTFSQPIEDERISPPAKRSRRSAAGVSQRSFSSSIGAVLSSTWSWVMFGLRRVLGSGQSRNQHEQEQTTEESRPFEMKRISLEEEASDEWSSPIQPKPSLSIIPQTTNTHDIADSSVSLASTVSPTPLINRHITGSTSSVKQHSTLSKPLSLYSVVLSPEVIGPQSATRHRFINSPSLPPLSTPPTAYCATPTPHYATPTPHYATPTSRCSEIVPSSISSSDHVQVDTTSKHVQTSHVIGHMTTKTQRLPEADRMRRWLQDFKTHHKHSVEEHRAILEVAEKKLRLHHQDRQSAEDARVSRLRNMLGLTRVSADEAVNREVNLEETVQERATVWKLLQGQQSDCLAQKFNIRISRGDLRTLSGLQWLNDEVINFYLNLVKERSGVDGRPKVHVFSTFFYPKLSQSGYSGVRRWTKKVDVFAYDLLLVPVHMGMHWCLAVIDFRKKQFTYYDSLSGSNVACFKRLKEYLAMESMDKRKLQYSTDEWSCITPKDIPCQENGSDCGVFSCMYARHVASDSSFEFSQQMMPAIREHMMIEIMKQCLL